MDTVKKSHRKEIITPNASSDGHSSASSNSVGSDQQGKDVPVNPKFDSSKDGSRAWKKIELARHPQRPYTLDYISRLFTDFSEIHGDRFFGDDPAIVCGFARFQGDEVMVVGHQKGRDIKQKVHRNFGSPNPEG